MLATRDKVIGCKGTNSTDCDQARTDAKLQSQETLLTAADDILSVLNALKEKIQSSTTLTDDEKSAAVADLDKKIDEIQAARDKVAALTDQSDNKAIVDAAKVIRQAWRDVRPTLHETASMLAYGELKAVTDAVERMSGRIDDQIARFKDKGVDVTTVTSLKASFDGAVADAITHLDKAKQAYLGITADNVDANLKTVRDEMKAARDSLQAAHDTLKNIVQELRTLAQQAKPTNKTAGGNAS
jgi:chromosome segregation ATPase